MTMVEKKRQRLAAIQALRGVAALAVAISHVQFDFVTRLGLPEALPAFGAGNSGVDLFFVISGFVMVYASETMFGRPGATATFLARRLARIVPLYWLVTAAYVAISLLAPLPGSTYTPAQILASCLFWPFPRPEGMYPVVGLGWTLNYEMFFYVIFGSLLTLGRMGTVLATTILLGGLILAGAVIALPQPLAYWSNPIVLEFVFGMGLGLAYRAGFRFPGPIGGILAATGGALLLLAADGRVLPEGPRGLTWGLPAAAVVAGCALRSVSERTGWFGEALAALGEASYALYLTHPMVIRAFREFHKAGLIDAGNAPWLYLALATLAAIAFAFLVHLAVERPITRWLQGRLSSGRPIAAAA